MLLYRIPSVLAARMPASFSGNLHNMWRNIASNAITLIVIGLFLIGGIMTLLKTEYYNTGQLQARINYKNDLQHGWTTSYDKFGKTQSRVMYRDGYALSESELKVFLERCKAKNIDPNQ